MAGDINRVVITGRLTKDPELRTLPSSDTSVCSLRIASNGRRRNSESGNWEDTPDYFDVTVWGQQGVNCQQYLSKGRAVGIDGGCDFASGPATKDRSATQWISSLNPSSSSAGVKTPVTGMASPAAYARPRAMSRSTPVISRVPPWLPELPTTTSRSEGIASKRKRIRAR